MGQKSKGDGNVRQRSLYLTDEAYAWLVERGQQLGLSTSSALDQLIREKRGGKGSAPVAAAKPAGKNPRGIQLPPDDVETFIGDPKHERAGAKPNRRAKPADEEFDIDD